MSSSPDVSPETSPGPSHGSRSNLDGSNVRDSKPPSRPGNATPAAIASVLVGHHLNHFKIEELIGGGGMGAVFRAHDQRLDRRVALKVIPHVADDPDLQRRFVNESQAAAKLDHPRIARVFEVGEDNRWYYIVFEFIEGTNLRDLVRRDGPMDIDDAVHHTIELAAAIGHASARGVTHRDIKPSNVVLADGEIKLVDMGLARTDAIGTHGDMTASGVTLGTFDYISPEQASDPRAADLRSDLYSLGCTLFYILTARPPYSGGTAVQKLLAHSSGATPDIREIRGDISESLAAVISRLLAKNPEDRFQTADALIDALRLIARREHMTRSIAGTVDTPKQRRSPVQQLASALVDRVGPRWLPVIPWAVAMTLMLAVAAGIRFRYADAPAQLRAPADMALLPSSPSSNSANSNSANSNSATSNSAAPGSTRWSAADGRLTGPSPTRGDGERRGTSSDQTGTSVDDQPSDAIRSSPPPRPDDDAMRSAANDTVPSVLPVAPEGSRDASMINASDRPDATPLASPVGRDAAAMDDVVGVGSAVGDVSVIDPSPTNATRPTTPTSPGRDTGVATSDNTPSRDAADSAPPRTTGGNAVEPLTGDDVEPPRFPSGVICVVGVRDAARLSWRRAALSRGATLTGTLDEALRVAATKRRARIMAYQSDLTATPFVFRGEELQMDSAVGKTRIHFDAPGDAMMVLDAETVDIQSIEFVWNVTSVGPSPTLMRLINNQFLSLTEVAITVGTGDPGDAANDPAAIGAMIADTADAVTASVIDFRRSGTRGFIKNDQTIQQNGFADASSTVPTSSADPMSPIKSTSPSPMKWMDMNNVMIRGRCDLLRFGPTDPFELNFSNGLVAIGGAMVRVISDTSDRRPSTDPSSPITMSFSQATIDAAGGLFDSDVSVSAGDPGRPTIVRTARKSVFVVTSDAPHIAAVQSIGTGNRTGVPIEIRGTLNAYDSDPTLSDPLVVRRVGNGVVTTPMSALITDGSDWIAETEPRMSVRWDRSDRPTQAWHRRTISDYQLDDDSDARGFESRWLPGWSEDSMPPLNPVVDG